MLVLTATSQTYLTKVAHTTVALTRRGESAASL